MKTNIIIFSLLFSVVLTGLFSSCANKKQVSEKRDESIPVIFETDMGNDIDDALALAMLNNYMTHGKVDLLAIMYNKDNPYSGEYIDIVDTWYGHGNIPIGKVVNGKTKYGPSYAKVIAEMKENGKPVFRRTLTQDDHLPGAVTLYRRILSQARDTSVLIISVGFSTNLARLLRSGPDSLSPLTGRELIRKKVKLLSIMAGCFDNTIKKEYNIYNDVPAARQVFDAWPGKIVVSPFEVGIKILYPAASIENDFSQTPHHPVADAYKVFMKMPYDRPCWDLTAVLQAVEPDSSWFTVSPPGVITVDTLTAKTVFTPRPGGPHRYLSVDSLQAKRVLQRLVTVVTAGKNPQTF